MAWRSALCVIPGEAKENAWRRADLFAAHAVAIFAVHTSARVVFFFKDDRAQRNYAKVPYYSTQQMADSFTLGNQSNSIESAICRFATDHYRDVKDENVVRLLQLLMDFYHFLDTEIIFQDELEEAGFAAIDQAIREDLGGFS